MENLSIVHFLEEEFTNIDAGIAVVKWLFIFITIVFLWTLKTCIFHLEKEPSDLKRLAKYGRKFKNFINRNEY